MVIKKTCLFLLLFFCEVFSGLSFDGSESTIEFKGPSSGLRLKEQLQNVNGRIKIPDDTAGRISAEISGYDNLIFNLGKLDIGVGDTAITGSFLSGAGDPISIGGGNDFNAIGKTIEKTFSVSSGQTATISGTPIFTSTINLGNSTSELRCNIANKMDQNIALNSGKVTLENDLAFKDNKFFTGSGTVDVNNRTLFIPAGNAISSTLTFLNAKDVQFTGDQTIDTGTEIYSGVGLESLVNGNGYILNIINDGKIQVGPSHKLYLTDMHIKNLGDAASYGYFDIDTTSTLALSNVTLELSGNYTHGAGTISIEGDRCFIIAGGNTFAVQNSNSRLRIDGVALSYRIKTASDPLPFSFSNLSQHRQLVNNGVIRAAIKTSEFEIINTLATSYTLTKNLKLNSSETITFTNATPGTPKAVTLDGANHSIAFPDQTSSFFVVDTNVQLTLQNVVLENFNPSAISYGAVSSTISFGDGVLIKLAKDFSIAPADRAWAFVGNAALDAQNNKLTIDGSSRMTLTGSSKTLTIKNTNLQFLSSQPLAINTASATFALDNSNLTLSSSGHNFSTGNLNVVNEVNLKGSWNIPNGLIFSSAGNLTIKSGATLTLTNTATLQYQANPANDGTNTAATKRHLTMEDATSTLKLVGSTLISTDTGLALDQGNLIFEGDCSINSSTANAAALEIASAVNVQIKNSSAANFYGPVIYG